MAHYFGAAPAIDIEKYVSVDGGTTWLDADAATGPIISYPNTVKFKVVVTNTGNVPLTGVAVTDTDFTFAGVVTSLAVGASDESDVLTTAAILGQHSNTADVEGYFDTTKVTDSDMAHYLSEIQYHDETAWAYGGQGVAKGFSELLGKKASSWGWTNYITQGSYTFDLIAGAGIGDNPAKGTVVGTVAVNWTGTTVTVLYHVDDAVEPLDGLLSTHLWIGATPLPVNKAGKFISDPGQLEKYMDMTYDFTINPIDSQTIEYTVTGVTGTNIYVAAHSVVRLYGE
jgi:hypothetical protein